MIVQPISEQKMQEVAREVQRYIEMASDLYKRSFAPIDVVFDIKGRAAGMYHSVSTFNNKTINNKTISFLPLAIIRKRKPKIRFNPWLFAKYPEESWTNTIPHEVAHYIADSRYDFNNIKPHGLEWRRIMQDFGAEPLVYGDYSLEGIPVRRVRRFAYRCACRQVELTSIRHRRIQEDRQQYHCRHCSGSVEFCGGEL